MLSRALTPRETKLQGQQSTLDDTRSPPAWRRPLDEPPRSSPRYATTLLSGNAAVFNAYAEETMRSPRSKIHRALTLPDFDIGSWQRRRRPSGQ
ncbi:unnamed protein product [Peniophora sp. CBMAI 1063]|nr:unnamed protein product [Peniophora sp. CBMAI 1063]